MNNVCPHCNTPIRSGAQFCSGCGNKFTRSAKIKPVTLSPGTQLKKRYEIRNVLAPGSFGAMYEAWDLDLNRACVLKENLNLSLQAQHEFKRKAKILAALNHPNLPNVSDYFELPHAGHYMVMEFVEGENLESLIQRQGAVTEKDAVEWISQAADALIYLHNQQPSLIHGEIKPSHIWLTANGRVLLTNLVDGKIDNHSADGHVTPGYSSPEQYGKGKIDGRADMYGLGATLYALLTGQKPPESVLRLMDQAKMPTLFAQGTPQKRPSASLQQVIERAMSLRPQERYQSMAEFKAALNASQSRVHPVPVPPNQARPVPVPPNQAHPVPVPPHNHSAKGNINSRKRTRRTKATTRSSLKPLYWIVAGVALFLLTLMATVLWVFNVQEEANAQALATTEALATNLTEESQTALALVTAEAQQIAWQAEQTATAQSQAVATLEPQLTATALAIETLQAQQMVTAQAAFQKADQTAIAQASAEAVAVLPTEATITATTPTVTSTPTSLPIDGLGTIEANKSQLFGPQSGSLIHLDNNFAESKFAFVDLTDFIVEATFLNPYPTTTGSWDYGFMFRNAGANEQFRLTIDSEERWALSNRSGEDSTLIDYGELPTLNLNEGASNQIKLIGQENKGWLYLNGDFITELHLSARTTAGDISITTGVYAGNEINGDATVYEGFTVWSISQQSDE